MAIAWEHFTPWSALLGGGLIGLAAAWLMLLNGRIAGISGQLGGLLERAGDWPERGAFVVGLVLAPAAVWLTGGGAVSANLDGASPALLIVAGLLVGFGSRLGGGCTSGHGVCGLARRSPRSLAATLCFMTAGFATVYLLRHVGG
ncbi:YeeE/YedE family protein [Neisseriaceae bacterium JH1-16]|nr:YeeE/YedE family protein [Neisseriaceae bacterium JH1-16]